MFTFRKEYPFYIMRQSDDDSMRITQARYGGVYEHGAYVLTVGLDDPTTTDAFGSDVDCAKFWQQIDSDGEFVEQDGKRVYYESGDLFELARSYEGQFNPDNPTYHLTTEVESPWNIDDIPDQEEVTIYTGQTIGGVVAQYRMDVFQEKYEKLQSDLLTAMEEHHQLAKQYLHGDRKAGHKLICSAYNKGNIDISYYKDRLYYTDLLDLDVQTDDEILKDVVEFCDKKDYDIPNIYYAFTDTN